MAFDSNGTKLANVVDPEVMADMIDKKLVNAMRFAPLADIDTTLVGVPGSTITLPSWNYIGDASTVAEGSDIAIKQLSASSTSATIHKLANAVQISDEAVLSGYGDPLGEAADQLILSIASALDGELLGVLDAITGTMLYETASSDTAIEPSDVNEALVKFGEDVDTVKVLICDPTLYKKLRGSDWLPASEMAADIRVRGAVGEAYGCQVIVSNKLTTSGKAFIVAPGALRLFLKRDTMVEYDRDIINKSTVISADKHEVAYLYDASKAIKLAPKA